MTTSRFDTRVPPPAVFATVGLAMWLVAYFTPTLSFHFAAAWGTALTLGALGLAVTVAGVVQFRLARTTVNPLKPAKAATVVTNGIYRFTRNPMYLGMLLVLAGWQVYLGNLFSLEYLLLFPYFITRHQIKPEEQALSAKFGEPYQAYMDRVRRWV